MKERVVLTVDDEDVNCNQCDNCLHEDFCNKFCGATHGWSGYEHTIIKEED